MTEIVLRGPPSKHLRESQSLVLPSCAAKAAEFLAQIPDLGAQLAVLRTRVAYHLVA